MEVKYLKANPNEERQKDNETTNLIAFAQKNKIQRQHIHQHILNITMYS